MEIIRRDKAFYDRSGGGVTLSGGEPLMQSDFAAQLLRACKEEGFHTCCDTALQAMWENVEQILPYTDLIISDIKHMDSRQHKEFTGVSNERILDNLRRLSRTETQIILRIPVIPGVNDDDENIEKTADFILRDMGSRVETLQLLSYMRLGLEKYQSLGVAYGMDGLTFDRGAFQERVRQIRDYFRGCVLPLAGIAASMLLLGFLPSLLMEKSFVRLLLCALLTSAAMLVSLWTIGMDAREKEALMEPVNKLIHRNKPDNE
jgi:pyruvate formate lyase activating enzyme